MVHVVRLTKNRYDIYLTNTGKYIGDASRGEDGVFRWQPFLSIYDVVEAGVLHAIASSLDIINSNNPHETEETRTSPAA